MPNDTRIEEKKGSHWTPLLDKTGIRLKVPIDKIKVVSGNLWGRGSGKKAVVDVTMPSGKVARFAVFGKSCGLPNCMCDAVIKPLTKQTI